MKQEGFRRFHQKPKLKRGVDAYWSVRDGKIIEYIWKWKVASTASIHEAINRTASPYSTYKILVKLETAGFVCCHHHSDGRYYVWSLTERGFAELRDRLGNLDEEGFQSENHRHDRLVQAFQLGEWATHQVPKVLFFTEQEIRRKELSQFPPWVPQTKDHKADGYTRIIGSQKPWTLAYEVELSPKSVERYEGLLRFYRGQPLVDQVLWLIQEDTIKQQILRAKHNMRDESQNYHVFVDLEDYIQNGWDAVITNERSETLSTLREKYQGICGDVIGEMLGKFRGQSRVTVHLANQKVLGKTRR